MNIPKTDEVYKHFKGNLYRIVTIATHSENGEKMVVYEALYGDHDVYVRPLDMFMSPVDKIKYPDVEQENRFELVEEQPEGYRIPKPVEQFLDAESFDERIMILTGFERDATNEDISVMATALELEIDEKLEKSARYAMLKDSVLLHQKYERGRAR